MIRTGHIEEVQCGGLTPWVEILREPGVLVTALLVENSSYVIGVMTTNQLESITLSQLSQLGFT